MMKYAVPLISLLILATWSLSITSCKKKQSNSDGNLEFSRDTLVFDTVFTTIGSTTGQFKIYNRDKKKLTIEAIELMGGSSSPFKMNFDGLQGTLFNNIEIEGEDSLFCFVEVTLNVNGGTLPMVVEDSIRFRSNGKDQYVQLVVWGQDMYYHYSDLENKIYDLNEGTWPNDKPHLIYGAAVVDSAKTLNIIGGTQIYMHKKSILYNYKGRLNIDGDYNNKVVIQGDRLESFYDNVPGQYYGVYYYQALPSIIDNVIIKNATAGIHITSKDSGDSTTVTITNSEIFNAESYGLFFFDSPIVVAENTLVHSNAVHALLVLKGADIKFTHCNLLGYGGGDGSYPAVGIRNWHTVDGITYITDVTGEFNNCVIYGAGTEELVFDNINQGGVNISFNFRNCLLRLPSSSDPMFSNCLFNQSPDFKDISNDDFTTYSSSSMKNNGTSLFTLPFDLLGIARDPSTPDIGTYEIQ